MTIASDQGVWGVSALRATTFVPTDEGVRDAVSWENLTGEIPDDISGNPKLRTFEESGQYENEKLILRHDPGRIDLQMKAAFPEDPLAIEGMPSLGASDDVIPSFVGVGEKLLGQLTENGINVSRLAFGAELIIPVTHHSEGYAVLSKFLPSVEIDPETADFIYGINRARISKIVPDLVINRLTRWSLRKLTIEASQHDDGIDFYACHLLLDINTVPQKIQLLDSSNLAALFLELVQLGAEITESGDVK